MQMILQTKNDPREMLRRICGRGYPVHSLGGVLLFSFVLFWGTQSLLAQNNAPIIDTPLVTTPDISAPPELPVTPSVIAPPEAPAGQPVIAPPQAPAIASAPSIIAPPVAPLVPPLDQVIPPVKAVEVPHTNPVVPPALKVGPSTAKRDDEIIPKSLFLSDEDNIRISNAIADFHNLISARDKGDVRNDSQSITDMNDTKAPGAAKEVEEGDFIYPQFFLASLVYRSPDDWLVIVNGRKITPQTIDDQSEITVTAIDNDKVLLKWKPANMAHVMEIWDKLTASQQTKPSNDENTPAQMTFDTKVLDKVPDVPVLVDKERKVVTFILRPNQTFSSFAMQVLEGKVAPVTLHAKHKSLLPIVAPVQVAKPANVNVAPPPVDDSNTGLNGLMKTIEKQSSEPKQ